MQKKLIAVAVAGALGLPAVAAAQNATVNIYGKLYVEWGHYNQGEAVTPVLPPGIPTLINRVDADSLQTPGSNIGFRGQEKLGGGLTAWFQCESTADPRGQSQEGWCSRDSALGIKGAFGNFYFGNWGTPFKRALIYTGSNATGFWGNASLLTGWNTTAPDSGSPQLWARRQNNLVAYDSPNFGGFTVSAAVTAANNATNNVENSSNPKPRLWSISGQYNNGPLRITAAYERHKDMLTAGAAQGAVVPNIVIPLPPAPLPPLGALFSGDESAWLIGARYTFAKKVTVGGMYTRQTWDTNLGALGTGDSHVSAWTLGAEWMISGPHELRVNYTQAGDVKGLGPAQPGGLRPGSGAGTVADGNTGAQMYGGRYVYNFSKRTEIVFGIQHVRNDRYAGYNIGGVGANGGCGGGCTFGGTGVNGKHTAYAMAIEHRF